MHNRQLTKHEKTVDAIFYLTYIVSLRKEVTRMPMKKGGSKKSTKKSTKKTTKKK